MTQLFKTNATLRWVYNFVLGSNLRKNHANCAVVMHIAQLNPTKEVQNVMVQSERRNVCQLYDNSWLTAEEYKKQLLTLSSVTKTDNLSMMISYNQLDLDLVGGGDVSISL